MHKVRIAVLGTGKKLPRLVSALLEKQIIPAENIFLSRHDGPDLERFEASGCRLLPDDASAKIYCDKSAGSINVNACGVNRDANDDEIITLNGGEYSITADVSAGSIKISNADAGQAEQADATTAVTTSTHARDVAEHVGDVVESAVAQAMDDVSDELEVL